MIKIYVPLTVLLACFQFGCLDPVSDPRPGPITETDAELFDARPPQVAPNTGSGYGSGTYQSGLVHQAESTFAEDAGITADTSTEEEVDEYDDD